MCYFPRDRPRGPSALIALIAALFALIAAIIARIAALIALIAALLALLTTLIALIVAQIALIAALIALIALNWEMSLITKGFRRCLPNFATQVFPRERREFVRSPVARATAVTLGVGKGERDAREQKKHPHEEDTHFFVLPRASAIVHYSKSAQHGYDL